MIREKLRLFNDYINFIKTAGNLHNLHSPFMYHLATKCLYDHHSYPEYQILKEYQKILLKDNKLINVQDYGAGSRIFKTQKRRIKDIAQIAGSSSADMKRLFRLVKYFQPKHILELGTSLGKATLAMALGNPEATIISVEGDSELSKYTQKLLSKFQITNVRIINKEFKDFFEENKSNNTKWDLVYMDGNHRLAPTLQYFDCLQSHLHNDSVVIVDDIYWSEEMKQAWETLKQHPNVRQSIDTFFFGVLFFRKEQYPQHFKINLNSLNLF